MDQILKMLLAIFIFTVYLFTWKLCTWPKISCSITSKLDVCIGMEQGKNLMGGGPHSSHHFPPGSIWRLSSNSIIFYRWIFVDQHHPPSVLVNNCHLPVTFPSSALFKPRTSLPYSYFLNRAPIGLNSSHDLFWHFLSCFNDYKLIVFRQ